MDDFQGKMYEMDWDFLVLFCLALYFIVSVIFAALLYLTGVRFCRPLPSCRMCILDPLLSQCRILEGALLRSCFSTQSL